TPRCLGLHAVIAKSYARIHWQNLANFGGLAWGFADPADYDRLESGTVLVLDGVRDALAPGGPRTACERGTERGYELRRHLSAHQVDAVLAGGEIRLMRRGSG